MEHSLDDGRLSARRSARTRSSSTPARISSAARFMPRPKAVIVVGLGEEGKLQAADLAQTVRQAVIAWAQRLAENKKHGTGVLRAGRDADRQRRHRHHAGEAARLDRPGRVRGERAPERRARQTAQWPRVSHLHFIELYLDRATDAWRALRMQDAATPGRYDIDDAVTAGTGPLQRPPDSGYRGADYDFITVETKHEKDGAPSISYTLDTRRARSEVRGQRTQSAAAPRPGGDRVERSEPRSADRPHAVQPADSGRARGVPGRQRRDADRARSAGRRGFRGSCSTRTASAIPTSSRGRSASSCCASCASHEFREQVTDADADASALVIGEPECPAEYPRLYGARREADGRVATA